MYRLLIGVTCIGILTIVACVPISQLPQASPAAPAVPTQTLAAATQAPPVAVKPTPTTAPATATTPPTAAVIPATATSRPTLASATATAAAPAATTAAATAASALASQATSGGPQKLNLDDYMPKGTARDLLLANCTACHSFVPIVTGQRTRARWDNIRTNHRDAVLRLPEKDYTVIYDYLAENFNDTKPEPKFPDWFLQGQIGTGE